MDVIHAEVVEIARERARAVGSLPLILASMMGTGTTSGSNGADQEMIDGCAEEIERLEVRRNRLATLRASITHENRSLAFDKIERAILDQLKLELLSIGTTEHQEAAAAAASAPEIEGLKRVWITKQSSSNNKCGGQQEGGREIIILDVCAICHEEWKIGDDVRSVMGCSHSYHYNCISKWIERKPTCPMCRYEIPTNTNNNKRRRTL